MIDEPCRKGKHQDCRELNREKDPFAPYGGQWCDCQHEEREMPGTPEQEPVTETRGGEVLEDAVVLPLLAGYYDTRDTSADMEHGTRAGPGMRTEPERER